MKQITRNTTTTTTTQTRVLAAAETLSQEGNVVFLLRLSRERSLLRAVTAEETSYNGVLLLLGDQSRRGGEARTFSTCLTDTMFFLGCTY